MQPYPDDVPGQADGSPGSVDDRPMQVLTATFGAAIVVGLIATLIAVLRAHTDGGRSDADRFVNAVGAFAQVAATQTTKISRDAAGPDKPAARARVSNATAELLPQLHRYQRLLVTAPKNVDLPQHRFIVAVRRLTTALGGVAHWATAGPAARASPSRAQLQAAAQRWNAAVTSLWRVAGAGPPPVIGR